MHRTTAEHQGWSIEGGGKGGAEWRVASEAAAKGSIWRNRSIACLWNDNSITRENKRTYIRTAKAGHFYRVRSDISSISVERCCKSACVRYASNSPRVGK